MNSPSRSSSTPPPRVGVQGLCCGVDDDFGRWVWVSRFRISEFGLRVWGFGDGKSIKRLRASGVQQDVGLDSGVGRRV